MSEPAEGATEGSAVGSAATPPSAQAVRAALAEIDIIPMLPALAQLTGDLGILRQDLRPDHDLVFGENGGLDASRLAEARQLALDAIMGLRGNETPTLEPAHLREMLRFLVGDGYLHDYEELLVEELAPPGTDPKAPGWTVAELAPDREFRVAVVGAGMSGIAAAHRLCQAGVDVTVFEKNDDVGGTWLENAYPGCRVDVPNHLYSYSFAQTDDWNDHYSTQPVLRSYFHQCAHDTGVHRLIRFRTEVVQATWDSGAQHWDVVTAGPDGQERVQQFEAVVSAVGQLNRPKYPAIPGRDDFDGPAFHSARWPEGLDLTGKRVAVIGTGASAMQLIPFVAHDAAHLTVFQRTPAWLVPTPDYFDPVPDGMRMLFRVVPTLGRWHRLWLFWRLHEGIAPAARVDPAWTGKGSVSAFNEMVREFFTGYLTEQFADDPDLLDRVLPRYPPISKRVVRDNGIWAETLRRDDVDLVTGPIQEITPSGVRLVDGTEVDVDIIIYGTGFEASQFLVPMKIVGRDGVDLHERWGDDARAYLGITIPGFPNLFCLYGPNTNLVVNGSIIYFSECEVTYLLDAVRLLLSTGHRSLEVRADVHDAYNAEVDEANAQTAWGASDVNTWYKNAAGRITQNWPWSILDFWRRTRHVDPDDYTLR